MINKFSSTVFITCKVVLEFHLAGTAVSPCLNKSDTMVVLTTQPIAFLKLKRKVCSATFIKAINGIKRNILQYIKWYKNEHTKAKASTIRHIKMVIHNFFMFLY